MSIAEVADPLGVHANTARFHLESMVRNGQVERSTADSGSPGRPPQLFLTAQGMDPIGPRHFRVLAEVLAASLATDPDSNSRILQAGRLWGRDQASSVADATATDEASAPIDSVERLMRLLDELGFAPVLTAGGDRPQIGLRQCPFLELAVSRSDVVCPVHLGLMQGAMTSWGSSVTVDRLEPFAEPHLCLANLSPATAS
jgi:predicted ArsR family transcriptional regulator